MNTQQEASAPAPARNEVEPYRIVIPEALIPEIDELVERTSRRLGESPVGVRRGVEVSLIIRGLRALQSEEGKR